jgi:hypothetical protein
MVPVPSSDSHRAPPPLRTYFISITVPVLSIVPSNVMWLFSSSPPAITTFEPLPVTTSVPFPKQSELTLDSPTRLPFGSAWITTVIVKGEKLGCRDWNVPDHVPVTSRKGRCAEPPADTTVPGWSDELVPCRNSVPANEMTTKRSEQRNRRAALVIVIHRRHLKLTPGPLNEQPHLP